MKLITPEIFENFQVIVKVKFPKALSVEFFGNRHECGDNILIGCLTCEGHVQRVYSRDGTNLYADNGGAL